MKALLVIDMQKTLFAAGNRHDTYGVISRINKILHSVIISRYSSC
ncbi:MAG TPA: cysteine hydrolase, partial [Desulfovibrio sp.]|nr:cysteine hydrolase [Desulfovibrio sp.]